MVVELRKWQKCHFFHNTSWHSGSRLTDVPVTSVEEDVRYLCLFREGSHGLDLSFVTHIFLLEPIHDAALLEQVVSRANRLGATAPVQVETIHVFQDLPDEYYATTGGERIGSTVRAICDACYKSFDSKEEAAAHEEACARNPKNQNRWQTDPFTLDSVYRRIRPPPPLEDTLQQRQQQQSTQQQSS